MQLFHRFQVILLQLMSRRLAKGRYCLGSDVSISNSLDQLKTMYPGILDQLQGKSIVDIGCGEGRQALALSIAGVRRIVGLDSNQALIENARLTALDMGVDGVTYTETLGVDDVGSFDYALSHNSMEHFSDPLGALNYIKSLIHADGEILITFGPPWYSPYGAHSHFFTKVPWVHLLFSEKAVITVRNKYTRDKATCFEDVQGGLNRMTLAKFHKLIEDAGMRIVYSKYIYMFGCDFLYYIPVLRELCLYHISVRLKCKEWLAKVDMRVAVTN